MTNEVDIHKDYKSLKNVMENSVSGKKQCSFTHVFTTVLTESTDTYMSNSDKIIA